MSDEIPEESAPAGGDAGEAAPVDEAAEGTGDGSGLWPVDRLRPLVEAILFASGDPLTAKRISEIVEGSTVEEVKATLVDLATEHLTRGTRLVEVAGGWQMRTGPEHQRYVRKLFRERPQRLSRAATETIAIVAYKQPVTRGEIETVRGVDSGAVLESLVERRLVKVVGRREVPGRPLVYATTAEFLELFGLRSIRELPTLPELGSEFERMSEQGGFAEREEGAILPLEQQDGTEEQGAEGEDGVEGEDGDGVEDDAGHGPDDGQGPGEEGGDEGEPGDEGEAGEDDRELGGGD